MSRLRRKDGRKEHPSESVGRISGDFGDFARRHESHRELFAIEWSAEQMPLERKVFANRTKAREKLLRAFQVAKAAHAPRKSTREMRRSRSRVG